MAYSLSFAPEFFVGNYPDGPDHLKPSDRPTSVYQAILRLADQTWEQISRGVFHCKPNYLDVESVLARAEETNTCSNLDSPVEVWIDGDGEFRVFVYDCGHL